jgi:Putative beta-barrel porin-2, OmpL-like. bbp2
MMKPRKTLFAIKILCLSIMPALTASLALAQSSSLDSLEKIVSDAPAGSDIQSPARTTNTVDNAQLLQELNQMRARIEELEKQLKGQSGDAPRSAGQPTHGGMQTVSLTAPASASSSAIASQQSSGDPAPAQQQQPPTPFGFADFSWLNGQARTKTPAFDSAFFTPEFRADVDYVYDFNRPVDDTIGGSSEVFRANEFHVTQLGVGGDFHYDNVQGRLMTQFGLYSQTTPRNDASPARGQWNLADAYRDISEAWGGYHFNVLDGVNVQAGIFLSYIGLFSYYQFDNWAYQPSYVSSNTPWFFNGMRVQIFPNKKLKIEPWLVNGWQSYGRFNGRPGVGGQILYRPNGNWSFTGNQYALGRDDLGIGHRSRYHTDDSVEYKYYDDPNRLIDKSALSLTIDAGCETGGGVSCYGNRRGGPKQSFLGFMLYNRIWLHKDLFGITLGGGAIDNPGRYLVLLPPINGATAASGTPYFTENPGDKFKALDASTTFDYMPSQYVTFRWEYNYRAANVPYFSGRGGITPPGGNTGALGSLVPGFTPDLTKTERRMTFALLVKF